MWQRIENSTGNNWPIQITRNYVFYSNHSGNNNKTLDGYINKLISMWISFAFSRINNFSFDRIRQIDLVIVKISQNKAKIRKF
jgi:hypothetical protein